MDFRRYWELARHYWVEKTKAYWQDFRRLDAASRTTAVGVLFLGILVGLTPLASMIVVFRLVDAVTGARAVRVMTSDLQYGLTTLVAVWLVATVAWALTRWFQGLTRRIVDRTALMVFFASVLVTTLLVAPFRTILIVLAHTILHPWLKERRIAAVCVLVHALLAYWILSTVTTYLLARAMTVGSYVLFLGAIFGAFTVTILHATQRRNDV